MGIITTIIFFSAIAYYMVHYIIRFVRYLKNKVGNPGSFESDVANKLNEEHESEETRQLDIPDEVLEIVFPGGEEEIDEEVAKLSKLLEDAHPIDLVKLVLVGSSVYFAQSEDKSEGKIIAYIQELYETSITIEEGKIIHDFIYTRALRVQFYVDENVFDFENFINDITELTGCDEDEIPGGSGAFGLVLTNPVPLKGIVSNEYYLNRIRTRNGEGITWERIGSTIPLHTSQPVDVYRIFNWEEREIARFYLSPYHRRVSNKAPEGFKLLTK